MTKLRASDGATLGTFAVGSHPQGVAFDGANIWVVNNASNTVTKLGASDGATLGTFTVGSGPQGVAFDGANIWVANYNDNTVTKLAASSGTNLGTFAAGPNPWSFAFDGANIWVTNHGSNTVTKLRASELTGSSNPNPVPPSPQGQRFWVYHDHGIQVHSGCEGWMAVGNGVVQFQGERVVGAGPLHSFNVRASEIEEAKRSRFLPSEFHIKTKGGNYNLVVLDPNDAQRKPHAPDQALNAILHLMNHD